MLLSRQASYIFTGIAVLAVIFLTATVFFGKATVLFQLFTPTGLTSTSISGEQVLNQTRAANSIPDPFVTLVPKDQQSPVSKSKVYVSKTDPLLGSPTAQVFVILFGDFADPEVANYLTLFEQLYGVYGDKVAFVWKDYIAPDATSEAAERSWAMATIAHCVGAQGYFWDYAHALLERTGDDDTTLMNLAIQSQADAGSASDCVASREYYGVIAQAYYYGNTVGVTNSHTLYINDDLVTEPLTQEALTAKIDALLAAY